MSQDDLREEYQRLSGDQLTQPFDNVEPKVNGLYKVAGFLAAVIIGTALAVTVFYSEAVWEFYSGAADYVSPEQEKHIQETAERNAEMLRQVHNYNTSRHSYLEGIDNDSDGLYREDD